MTLDTGLRVAWSHEVYEESAGPYSLPASLAVDGRRGGCGDFVVGCFRLD